MFFPVFCWLNNLIQIYFSKWLIFLILTSRIFVQYFHDIVLILNYILYFFLRVLKCSSLIVNVYYVFLLMHFPSILLWWCLESSWCNFYSITFQTHMTLRFWTILNVFTFFASRRGNFFFFCFNCFMTYFIIFLVNYKSSLDCTDYLKFGLDFNSSHNLGKKKNYQYSEIILLESIVNRAIAYCLPDISLAFDSSDHLTLPSSVEVRHDTQ